MVKNTLFEVYLFFKYFGVYKFLILIINSFKRLIYNLIK